MAIQTEYTVPIAHARTCLGDLIRRANEGARVILTVSGVPGAVLVPLARMAELETREACTREFSGQAACDPMEVEAAMREAIAARPGLFGVGDNSDLPFDPPE